MENTYNYYKEVNDFKCKEIKMDKLPLPNFLGNLVGAGVIYIFSVLLHLLVGEGFNLFFFFFYWDLMLAFILFLHILGFNSLINK